MRIIAALGGNALLERGEPPESAIQEAHVVTAVRALAPLAADHDLAITHGNGPQVGMLALESAHDPALARPYPFDVLGAQTQGMIGYWLVQALQNAVPGRQVACLVSRTLVRGDDPAFAEPAKFVGPVYDEEQARALAAAHGWEIRRDGARWCPRPSQPNCSTCPPSACCSAAGPSWSAPAAGASPWWLPTAGCAAWRRSWTRT